MSVLEEKSLVIQKNKERLAQREEMLLGMLSCTRESLHLEYDSFQVQEHEEEWLEVLPTTVSALEPATELAKRVAEYIVYYEKEGRIPSYPHGVVLAQSGLVTGRYLESFFFSRATRFTPDFQLRIKAKGRYAVMAHRGSVQTHLEAFEKMLGRIRRSGMTIAGDAYVYDMMSIFLLGNTSVHSSKYCIRVE